MLVDAQLLYARVTRPLISARLRRARYNPRVWQRQTTTAHELYHIHAVYQSNRYYDYDIIRLHHQF